MFVEHKGSLMNTLKRNATRFTKAQFHMPVEKT